MLEEAEKWLASNPVYGPEQNDSMYLRASEGGYQLWYFSLDV